MPPKFRKGKKNIKSKNDFLKLKKNALDKKIKEDKLKLKKSNYKEKNKKDDDDIDSVHSYTSSDTESESSYYSSDDVSVSSDEYDGCEEDNFLNELIANKYYIIKKLGSGAFASVWLTYNLVDDKYYAIKIQMEDDIESAQDEIKILKRIDSKNCHKCMRLHDNFKYKNTKRICMVFPLLGCDLVSLQRKQGLPLKFVKKIFKDILYAVYDLHKKANICHTDLKPENVLVKQVNLKTLQTIKLFEKNVNPGALVKKCKEQMFEKYQLIKKKR